MKNLLLFLFALPLFSFGQVPEFRDGIPDDLKNEKLIILEHEPVKVTGERRGSPASRYLYERQKNHNKVLEESNQKLKGTAMAYPYEYAITSPSTYMSLAKAGYKYVLKSSVYNYEQFTKQPEDNALIVYEYFIYDMQNNIAYRAFKLDEMKVYDFKLIIKKLNKAIKHAEKED